MYLSMFPGCSQKNLTESLIENASDSSEFLGFQAIAVLQVGKKPLHLWVPVGFGLQS